MKKNYATLTRLGRYFAPYKKLTILLLVFIALTAMLQSAIPYISGLPTTEIGKNITSGESVNFSYIGNCLIVLLVIGVSYCITQLLSGLWVTKLVQNIMRDLRNEIEEKLNCLPVSYFDRNQRGNILSRITNDVDTLSNALQQSFINIINALLIVSVSIFMMFYINTIMALLALIMIPLSLLISKYIIRFSQKYFKSMQNSLGELNGYVQERLTAFDIIKLYGKEENTIDEFKKINLDLKNYGLKATFISGLMMPLVLLTAYLAYIVISVLGSFYIISGVIVVGQLQAFIQYIWQINKPLGNITQLSSVLQSASAATGRIFEILDELEEIRTGVDRQPLPEQVMGNIKFENVNFSYDPKKPLIQNLNMDVKAGQTVAIVGPTGAGKSTLINLLMRFYDTDSGTIKIDGVDIREAEREDVRKLFGMVLQDAWLFEGSISENIRFGKLDATDYEVVDAAKTANVDHFIRTMPDCYNMVINSEGDNISLGQKQLLTIARAILADPKILILDEATSSVDTRLEVLIQKAMTRIMKGRTSFIIAHRLSTIRNADMILVMKEGTIVEQGRHDELLNLKGFYAELYNSQFQN